MGDNFFSFLSSDVFWRRIPIICTCVCLLEKWSVLLFCLLLSSYFVFRFVFKLYLAHLYIYIYIKNKLFFSSGGFLTHLKQWYLACWQVCKFGISGVSFVKKERRPSVSIHYAKSGSLSQQIGAGGDCPHHLWHPLPPPPTPCALRPLRSGHVTHSTTEWDAPSFGFSRESWQNERPGRHADGLLGLTTVGHLWWAFVFVFLSSWKNKLIGKKRCAGTNWCVLGFFFPSFLSRQFLSAVTWKLAWYH